MYNVILITAKDKTEAQSIADRLVGDKLAACVNIVDSVISVYRWEGRVNKETEVLLIVKSKTDVLAKVIETVKSIHSYSVPEIIALPIVGGNEDYLKWIEGNVKSR